MGKKATENRYGVQVGDIFVQHCYFEDFGSYNFYQVTALRGETQVVVRPIKKKWIAFDGDNEEVAPIPGAWMSEETLVRKVYDGSNIEIHIEGGWCGWAFLYDPDSGRKYKEWSAGVNVAYLFERYNPEIAGQLDLEKGSGVYIVDGVFGRIGDDCLAEIRYPDGRKQEVTLRELLHY